MLNDSLKIINKQSNTINKMAGYIATLDIEEDIILSPCPLAAYTLFTYGFINKSTYIAATKKMYEKNYEEYYNSLNKTKKYSIVVGVQRNMVDCIVGCNQECHITEANKI